tara:strand:+ start:4003 stop:5433 length:1431 start_codon:yes stop_codon:yes gene_type:complete
MNLQQARKLLEKNAPKGEFPAYINPQEASWLKGMGASGRKTKSGLRSFARDDDFVSQTGGGDAGNFGERGRNERDFNYSPSDFFSGKTKLDVGGWLKDKIGGGAGSGRFNDPASTAGEGREERERQRLRNMQMQQNMPAGGGGGTPAGFNTRQNTQSSISEIDRPTHEFRQKVFDKASDVMGREYEAYEGDRFAKPAQDTLDAQQGIRDLQGQGQDVFTAGQQTGQNVAGYTPDQIQQQSFLSGQGVDQYMNPHTQNVIQNLQKNAMDTMQMQRNQLGSQAQMSGAGMGSRSAIEKGVMAAGVQRDLNQQTGDLLNKSFADASAQKRQDMEMEQARQRYNQGANMEGQRLNLAGADMASRQAGLGRQAGFQDAQMLSKVGADIEGREQNELDWDYDQAMEKRDWDKNQAMFGSNVLGGAPFGTQTQQSQPQYQNQRGGRFGSALAGAAAGSAIHPVYGTAIGAGLGWLSGGGGGFF